MIKSETHYKITKQQIEMFKKELVLNTAEKDAIQSLLNELESQVRKYKTSNFYGWTDETLGECAKIHMDQILDAFYTPNPNETILLKYERLRVLVESYKRITNDLKCLPQK